MVVSIWSRRRRRKSSEYVEKLAGMAPDSSCRQSHNLLVDIVSRRSLEIFLRSIAQRMRCVDRSLASREIGIETRRGLITPIEFVKPCTFEKVMLHSSDDCRLVEAPKFDVGGHSCRDIESVQCSIRAGWDREKRAARNILRQEILGKSLRNVRARL